MEKGRLIRMAKVNIIYWSGTGNTAAMAAAIAEGAKKAGAEAELITAETASADDVRDAKAIALGCPSMGAEQLEETIMEPLMEELDGAISGKTVVLFGSYATGCVTGRTEFLLTEHRCGTARESLPITHRMMRRSMPARQQDVTSQV